MEWKYSAFLSYATADIVVASRLQKFLEGYRVPRPLRGTQGLFGAIPSKAGKIFRDRTDAAGAADLRMALRAALEQSRDLIVLCSPAAADSKSWVNKEIEDFRALRPTGRILAIISSGEPPHCFPSSLRNSTEMQQGFIEPLAADMRSVGDGPREAPLKLVAALLGVDFDQLRRREEIARRRRRLLLGSLGAGYLMTVTIGAVLVAQASIELARSRSLALADRARTANESGHHDLAALLALAALPPQEGAVTKVTPQAETQLRRALVQGQLRRVIPVQNTTIWSMSRHPTEPWVLTGGAGGEVRLVNWKNGRVSAFSGHQAAVTGTDVSPDGRSAVTTGMDNTIRIWSLPAGREKLKILTGDWTARSVSFSPRGRHFVAACSDGFARVFHTASGSEVTRSPAHGARVMSAAFSRIGTMVMSGAYDGRLIEWDSRTGQMLLDIGKVGTIDQISLEPGGDRWVVTRALADVILFWEAMTSQPTFAI